MPLSSVDVGANTVRLLVGEASGGRVLRIRHERVVTRLARGMAGTGVLSAEGMEATLRALEGFSRTIEHAGVDRYRAVGTSALREARNASEFIELAHARTGMGIEVIPGDIEAELTARGVLSSVPAGRPSLIIDIGGGSTEWMLCRGGEVVDRATVPVGVAKLHERHLGSDPPSARELKALGGEAREVSGAIAGEVSGRMAQDTVMILTGGTATTLASLDLGLGAYEPRRVHMHEVSLVRLYEISRTLFSLPLKKRKGLRGLEPERADLIVPGAELAVKLMESLGFKRVLISDQGLLEGVLLELSEGDTPS